MRAVIVVDLVFEDANCVCGAAVLDAVADMDWVLVIVDATTLAVGMVMGVRLISADVWSVAKVDEDEALVAVEEDADDDEEAVVEVLWDEVMVDAAPVEVEMVELAGLEATDEVVVREVSDTVDWETMEVAIWEPELAEGKFTTGTSRNERRRFGPWRRWKVSSCEWTSDGMVIIR